MKILTIMTILVLSTLAQANTIDSVFSKNSVLPTELQKRILEAINTKCSSIVSYYGLTEVNTELRTVRTEQNVVDNYYTSVFSSTFKPDGMHPDRTFISVESAEYSYFNGDNLTILNVSSDNKYDCN